MNSKGRPEHARIQTSPITVYIHIHIYTYIHISTGHGQFTEISAPPPNTDRTLGHTKSRSRKVTGDRLLVCSPYCSLLSYVLRSSVIRIACGGGGVAPPRKKKKNKAKQSRAKKSKAKHKPPHRRHPHQSWVTPGLDWVAGTRSWGRVCSVCSVSRWVFDRMSPVT